MTAYPLFVNVISQPSCWRDPQEGLNIEVFLLTNPSASQVNTLKRQAPSPSSIHLFTLRKVSQHVPSEALLSIHVRYPRWIMHPRRAQKIWNPLIERSRTSYPSLNPPNKIGYPINRRIRYKTEISVRFIGGYVIISTVILANNHTLSGTYNLHVVPGFS